MGDRYYEDDLQARQDHNDVILNEMQQAAAAREIGLWRNGIHGASVNAMKANPDDNIGFVGLGEELMKKCEELDQPIVKTRVGRLNVAYISNLDLVKEALEKIKILEKPTAIFNESLKLFKGVAGSITASYLQWKRVSRSNENTFSRTSINKYGENTYATSVEFLTRRIKDRLDDNGQVKLDLFDLMEENAVRSMIINLFGDEELITQDDMHKLLEGGGASAKINLVSAMLPAPIAKLVLGKDVSNFNQVQVPQFQSILSNVIESATGKRALDPDYGKGALIGHLLDHVANGRITPQEMGSQLGSYVFASIETTQRALKGIVLAANAYSEQWDLVAYAMRNDLGNARELFTAFAREVIRFHPGAPTMFREAQYGDVNLGSFKIKKDTILMFSPYLLHRNPDIFVSPDNFSMGRFMKPTVEEYQAVGGENSKEYKAAVNIYNNNLKNFLGFGYGMRKCIGEKMAFEIMFNQLKAFVDLNLYWHIDNAGEYFHTETRQDFDPKVSMATIYTPRVA